MDLFDVMKEVDPAIYGDWVEPEKERDPVDLTRFYFDVQAGLVAVGLQANWEPPGERGVLLLGTCVFITHFYLLHGIGVNMA